MEVVQDVLGNVNILTTRVYTKTREQRRARRVRSPECEGHPFECRRLISSLPSSQMSLRALNGWSAIVRDYTPPDLGGLVQVLLMQLATHDNPNNPIPRVKCSAIIQRRGWRRRPVSPKMKKVTLPPWPRMVGMWLQFFAPHRKAKDVIDELSLGVMG